MENAISNRYSRVGETACADPEGIRRTYPTPYSIGDAKEIAILRQNRDNRMLSRHIQIASQSVDDMWGKELHLPQFESDSKHPKLEEQLSIFGGWKRWGALAGQDRGVKGDSLWMYAQRDLRGMLPRGVFGGATTLSDDAPKRLLTDTVFGWISIPDRLDGERKDGGRISTPDLFRCYPVVMARNRTRAGGRQLAPPITPPTSL